MEKDYEINNDIQEYNLSLSQFAKLCGTTRDTLRFYYENELLVPRIDESNGYHYYSSSQINSFFFISTFRQAGCSIKEIKELLKNSTKDSVQTMAYERLSDMQKELSVLQSKISSLTLGLQLLERHDISSSNGPFEEELTGVRFLSTPIRHNKNAHHTGDIVIDISQHMTALSEESNLSIFPTGVTMNYNNLVSENYIYNNIITLTGPASDVKGTNALPSSRVVSCFHDGANVGFVFPAEETDVKYEIEVYNLSGKRTMEKDCSVDYSGIDMLDGEILLYDTRNLNAYRPGGRQKLSLSYPQAVRYFAPLPGQRNYLVVTENSIDRIRAE